MRRKLHAVHVIPTYNEVENIGTMLQVLDELAKKQSGYRWSVLVVDDNSPDGTAEIAQKTKINLPLDILKGEKQGLGIAMRRGFEYAIEEMEADLIVSNDADFQFDPRDIPRLLEAYESGADVVIGSRHVPGGGVTGWPKRRAVTHYVANTLFARYLAGLEMVEDHNGNFRIYRVENVLDQVDWGGLPSDGYGFLNYILYVLSKAEVVFVEVPVEFGWRVRGESKVSFNPRYVKSFFHDTIEYMRLCLQIRWETMRS